MLAGYPIRTCTLNAVVRSKNIQATYSSRNTRERRKRITAVLACRVELIGFITKSPKFIFAARKQRFAFANRWLKCNYCGPCECVHASIATSARCGAINTYRAGPSVLQEQRGFYRIRGSRPPVLHGPKISTRGRARWTARSK